MATPTTRPGGVVLDSVECVSEEEIEIINPKHNKPIIYVPVIVTTAELQTCQFSAASVSADRGEIKDGNFEQVRFVNFSKGFSTKHSLALEALDQVFYNLKDANKANERSVFVVNTSHVEAFLIVLKNLFQDSGCFL